MNELNLLVFRLFSFLIWLKFYNNINNKDVELFVVYDFFVFFVFLYVFLLVGGGVWKEFEKNFLKDEKIWG